MSLDWDRDKCDMCVKQLLGECNDKKDCFLNNE